MPKASKKSKASKRPKSKKSKSSSKTPFIQFPKEPVTANQLPLRIGKNISVERYNTYLKNRESNAYKLKREKNGEVFIIDIPSLEHERVVQYVQACLLLANGANFGYLPIESGGGTFHESPLYEGTNLEPDACVAPHPSLVRVPPRPHWYPGPPPGNHNGSPYARIVCEVGCSQSTSDLWEKCIDWIQQPYVRYVIGIKLHEKRTTKNALRQFHRSMTARVYVQPGAPRPTPPYLPLSPPEDGPIPLLPGQIIPDTVPPESEYFEWDFGTHTMNTQAPGTCTALGLPDYQIQLASSEIFWDPPFDAAPVPTVPAGYIATIPAALIPALAPAVAPPARFLPIAPTINIDLYMIQEMVLERQINE